jgi:hypothetical protein
VSPKARTAPPKPAAAPAGRKVLLGLVLASSIVSVLAIVWFEQQQSEREAWRRVDPANMSGDVEAMTETAQSFVLFWSTFRYEEATHVSTEDSLARVELAMAKEKTYTSAERQLATKLRATVADLEVTVEPHSVVDEDVDRKVLRATVLVKATDRTVRREQEFVMARENGNWKVASWDPGEAEAAPDDAVEPGLQLMSDEDAGAP